MSVIMTYLLHFLCLCNYENRMWFGMVVLETGIPFVSALTFRYLCWYENRLRFGIAKSETRFPFVSALTFRYLCIKCRAVSWYICGNFLYDRDCLCKKNRECEYVGFVEFVAWLS